MKCYYCKEFKQIEKETDDQAFCNEQEHKLWANKHYGKKEEVRSHEIEYMQRKLLEWGKESKGK